MKKRRKWPKGTHDQVTRQVLAFAVLTILATLYLLAMGALVCGCIDGEKFTIDKCRDQDNFWPMLSGTGTSLC